MFHLNQSKFELGLTPRTRRFLELMKITTHPNYYPPRHTYPNYQRDVYLEQQRGMK